ncbi:hypothetical protein [Streptomyces mirabilis]
MIEEIKIEEIIEGFLMVLCGLLDGPDLMRLAEMSPRRKAAAHS